MAEGNFPVCAMMQVAMPDTHADYLICRGYDPRVRKFFDYVEDDEDKLGIPVAKPYGKRQVGQYEVGQVYAALIPLTRIGQTAGVAADTQGHPADLDEEIEILYTDDDIVVTWLLIDSAGGGGSSIVRFELIDDMNLGECGRAFLRYFKDDDDDLPCGYWYTDTSMMITVQDPAKQLCGWGGWEYEDGEWVRPDWCGDDTGTGTADFDESNIGSIGAAYLPTDATIEFEDGTGALEGYIGTGTGEGDSEPIYEVLWMVEPCEMFYAEVDGDFAGDEGPLTFTATSQVPMHNSRNRRFWQNIPPTSVENVFNWYVNTGSFIICARKDCHSYYPIQVACPPVV